MEIRRKGIPPGFTLPTPTNTQKGTSYALDLGHMLRLLRTAFLGGEVIKVLVWILLKGNVVTTITIPHQESKTWQKSTSVPN